MCPSNYLLGAMSKPSIFLWRYKTRNRNYPGYHMTADGEGIDLIKSRLSDPQHPLKRKCSLCVNLSTTHNLPVRPLIVQIGESSLPMSLQLWGYLHEYLCGLTTKLSCGQTA